MKSPSTIAKNRQPSLSDKAKKIAAFKRAGKGRKAK